MTFIVVTILITLNYKAEGIFQLLMARVSLNIVPFGSYYIILLKCSLGIYILNIWCFSDHLHAS